MQQACDHCTANLVQQRERDDNQDDCSESGTKGIQNKKQMKKKENLLNCL